ncbi:uncharacterized protein Tco025E_00103 [Trypanosoma conorhini]|uniref:Uncharacterized protein n=1 Tax=Trypanosoma conorhini TaxID=83891 RepID=A0A3R7LI43_9TRYP|nr:uncharacterized protein Tco025E_00103 [Trypanosoma conorhini]RNF27719.1 hypothetical protein Tco025E_00103 [Trypanosoma conorhini]
MRQFFRNNHPWPSRRLHNLVLRLCGGAALGGDAEERHVQLAGVAHDGEHLRRDATRRETEVAVEREIHRDACVFRVTGAAKVRHLHRHTANVEHCEGVVRMNVERRIR